jgi:type II secretory pathway pseudopilin PulG
MKRKNMTYARTPRWCWLVAAILAVTVLPSAARSVAEDANNEKAERGIRVAQNAQSTSRPTNDEAKPTRPPALLSYGDGKADGKKSYGGNGHMIRFEMPEGVTNIRGLRIHGSRYGLAQAPDEDFEITFLSDDREEILDSQAAPYRLFKRGKEAWVRVMFDKEVELPEKFWVALNFNAHQTKGVYLSYDTSTKGEYSRAGLPGDEEEPKETDFGGDWMVQVMLARPAK